MLLLPACKLERRKVTMYKNNKAINIQVRLLRLGVATGLVLLIPLVAMQFTKELNWGVEDFVIMGVLLFAMGLIYELAVRRIQVSTRRIIAGVVLALIFILIWAELAVGIFGTPFAGS